MGVTSRIYWDFFSVFFQTYKNRDEKELLYLRTIALLCLNTLLT